MKESAKFRFMFIEMCVGISMVTVRVQARFRAKVRSRFSVGCMGRQHYG